MRRFLEDDAVDTLLDIKKMANYRNALAATNPIIDIVTEADLKLDYSCWRSPEKDLDGRKMYTFHVIVDASDNDSNSFYLHTKTGLYSSFCGLLCYVVANSLV